MERVIVVEVLDRRGRVRDRVRLSRLPAFVGRAYTNDVVLEDRFVSPQHCAIRETESGEMVVEDLDSLNGVKVLTGAPSGSLTVRSGDRFRVGETILRLVDGAHPVAPAEPLPADEGGILHGLRDFRLALAIVAASLHDAPCDHLGLEVESFWGGGPPSPFLPRSIPRLRFWVACGAPLTRFPVPRGSPAPWCSTL